MVADLPEFTKDFLVELGGWAAWREARALFHSGAVREAVWEAPYLEGRIEKTGTANHVRLNLRSLNFPENQCACLKGRQGFICSHALAVCMQAQADREQAEQATQAAAAPVRETAADASPEEATDAADVQSLKLSEQRGIPLKFRILLPPNLKVIAPRNAVVVKLEADVEGEVRPPEKIDRGRAYRLEPKQKAIAALVEGWCGGKLHGLLQLDRSRMRSLLGAAEGEPVVRWVNAPEVPLPWNQGRLAGVHEHLAEPSADAPRSGTSPRAPGPPGRQRSSPAVRRSPPRPAARPQRTRPAASVPGRRRIDAPSRAVARAYQSSYASPQVDGSTHFLAIQLPSTDHTYYRKLRDLLKDWDFRLEPSNRRWWLRDRHKTLNFLARHWTWLRDDVGAEFSDNFRQRTAEVRYARVKADARKSGGSFSLTVALEAGGHSEGELRQNIARGQHYVEDGKQVYLLEPEKLEELEKAQQRISGETRRTLTTRFEQTVTGAGVRDAEAALAELDETFEPPDAWKQRSAALASIGALEPAPLPQSLDDTLRNYQRIGVAWLHHLQRHGLGGVLADEMGLGKTLQALALLQAGRLSNGNAEEDGPRRSKRHTKNAGNQQKMNTSLVVAPASLLENWRREAQRFTPDLKVYCHHGNHRLETVEAIADFDLVITSYGTLVRDAGLFRKCSFATVIADEAQHIKNRRTQNAAALRALQARGRFALTGTPIENSLDDLRSLFDYCLPGYLAKVPSDVSTDERQWYRSRHREQAAPYILRRGKRMVAPELPEKIEQVLYCEMGTRQEKLYREVQERTRKEIFEMEMAGKSENAVRFAALTQLLRLRQVCVDPRLIDDGIAAKHSAKLEAFLEILEEAQDDGHRILVFSQFTSALALIREALEKRGYGYCYLDGSTRNRQAQVDRFNDDDAIPVFLISLKAGGTGLNLTGADTVVHFDPWWNPAVEAQATDRAHRIGQTRVVTSIKLIATGTVEERVVDLQKEKAELLRDLLDESAAATAKVSMAEIKELLEG